MNANELEREMKRQGVKDDYLSTLGTVGIKKALSDMEGARGDAPINVNIYGSSVGGKLRGGFDNGDVGSSSAGVGGSIATNQMKSVSISNSLDDIVRPLADRLNLIHLEDRQFMLNNHLENLAQFRMMNKGIHRMNTETSGNIVDRMTASYREFVRAPLMSFMKSMKTVTSPLVNISKSILFGKAANSPMQEIVKAIRQQTQFLQFGEVFNSQNMFQRLISKGVLGGALDEIKEVGLSALQLDRKTAQESEKKRAKGEDVGWLKNIGLTWRRGEIDQLGRQGTFNSKTEASEGKDNKKDTPSILMDIFNTLIRIEDFGYEQAGVMKQNRVEENHLRLTDQRDQEETKNIWEHLRENDDERMKREEKSFKTQKKQLKEAETTNSRLFMQTLMQGLSSIAGVVSSLGAGALGLAGGLLGGKGRGKGGFFSKIFNKKNASTIGSAAKAGGGGILKGAGGLLKRIPILGTLLAGGTLASTLMDNDLTDEQKKSKSMKQGGGIVGGLSGAAAGAAMGSVVPVVGTAIGGIVGGIAGSFLGSAGVEKFQEEITGAFTFMGDVFKNSWTYVKDKVTSVGGWFKDLLGIGNDEDNKARVSEVNKQRRITQNTTAGSRISMRNHPAADIRAKANATDPMIYATDDDGRNIGIQPPAPSVNTNDNDMKAMFSDIRDLLGTLNDTQKESLKRQAKQNGVSQGLQNEVDNGTAISVFGG